MDMQLSAAVCEQARQSRDPRFDGRFFIAVTTTGVFCRPVCRVKMPKAANVRFFASAAAASEAGFRPCLRCRPESAPGTPAWRGTSATASRALRLINEGALDEAGIEALAERLGVTSRHLRRLFERHLGASPAAVARTRRLLFAKRMLDETTLPMTRIAHAAGYGSLRRFNDHVREVYGRTPGELRKSRPTGEQQSGLFSVRLPVRLPYDFDGVLAFLARRAIPGVETVTGTEYRRSFTIDGDAGAIVVRLAEDGAHLACDIRISGATRLITVVDRIKRLFDADADPWEIGCWLGKDAALQAVVATNPGQRVPGAWDPFELAVRAIVGQQVSVTGATTVMGRISTMYGEPDEEGGWRFPSPERLAQLDVTTLSMPRARAAAIRGLATAVVSGEVDLTSAADPETLRASLEAIKGIGPWTAHYVCMRALGDPDAFLHSDLVLLKVARTHLDLTTANELLERSQAWRPWRAYAGMHLWRLAANAGG